MDLKLREVTWLRLLALLAWTVLVMVKRGVSYMIEVIEGRVFERGVPTPSEEVRESTRKESTLIPQLSDEVVISQIWPLLHRKVNISLLWRLRRVNRAWKETVARSLEWTALEIVRIDTPGYVRYLELRGERRPSLRERVEDELSSISRLLSERLADFEVQSVCLQPWFEAFEESDEEWGSSESPARTNCTWAGEEIPCSENRDCTRGCNCSWREGLSCGEACESSSSSSMRVYYPRHQVRIKNWDFREDEASICIPQT